MFTDVLSYYEFLRRTVPAEQLLTALFEWNGTRLVGDGRLEVKRTTLGELEEQTRQEKRHWHPDQARWWYRIQPIEGYEFLRFPVTPNAVVEELNSARYHPDGFYGNKAHEIRLGDEFRYVALSDYMYKDWFPSNVETRFWVVAYRPTDIFPPGNQAAAAYPGERPSVRTIPPLVPPGRVAALHDMLADHSEH